MRVSDFTPWGVRYTSDENVIHSFLNYSKSTEASASDSKEGSKQWHLRISMRSIRF